MRCAAGHRCRTRPTTPLRLQHQRHMMQQCRFVKEGADAMVQPAPKQGSDGAMTSAVAVRTSALLDNIPAAGCPVLRQLKALPQGDTAWWRQAKLEVPDPSQMQQLALQRKPFVLSSFLTLPALVVGDLGAAKELLASEGRAVTMGWPASVVQLIGPSSLLNAKDQERHRTLRRLINPALRQDAIDAAVPKIQELVTSYFDRWAAEGAAGRTIKAYPEVKKLAFEVIARLLVEGLNDATLSQMRRYFQQYDGSLFTPGFLLIDSPPFPFHYAMNARRGLEKILSDQLALVRQKLAHAGHDQPVSSTSGSGRSSPSASSSGQAQQPCAPADQTGGGNGRSGSTTTTTVLERMVMQRDDDGRGLSDEEIVDNLVGMFFAGYGNTSSAMTSMLHVLARHPAVLERLRQEQREVVAAHGEQITGEALRRMPYAEATMRELFRYRVIVPGVFRTTRDDTELQGHAVPKGLMVSIGLATMIKDDARFAGATGTLAPECFAPERFMTKEGRSQGSQVPFGIGNRTCPGSALTQTEVLVLLAVLARGYDFSADWNTQYIMFPNPRPKNDLPVYFKKLQATA